MSDPLIRKVARRFLARHDYYKVTPDMSIEDVARRFVKERDKPRGGGTHGFYSVRELWPLREYTWTRDNAREGHARTEDGEYVNLPGPQKWDMIKEDMRKHGWRKDEVPLRLFIGKDGNVKVGEGNHRLAIARELGMKKLPVKFMFRNSVRNGHHMIDPPDEEIY